MKTWKWNRERAKKAARKGWTFTLGMFGIAAVYVAVCGLGVLVGNAVPPPDDGEPSGLSTGRIVQVERAFLAVDYAALEAYNRACLKRDTKAVRELLESGKLFTARGGEKAAVLGLGATRKPPGLAIYRLRILDGEWAGREAVVLSEFVRAGAEAVERERR